MSNNLFKLLYVGNFLTKHGMSPNQGAAIVGILKKEDGILHIPQQ